MSCSRRRQEHAQVVTGVSRRTQNSARLRGGRPAALHCRARQQHCRPRQQHCRARQQHCKPLHAHCRAGQQLVQRSMAGPGGSKGLFSRCTVRGCKRSKWQGQAASAKCERTARIQKRGPGRQALVWDPYRAFGTFATFAGFVPSPAPATSRPGTRIRSVAASRSVQER